MVDDLDRQIAALQRDTRHRQVITVAVVVGIFAAVAGSWVVPYLFPWFVPSPRSPGMLVSILMPFAICYGLGHAAYRLLRWLRG